MNAVRKDIPPPPPRIAALPVDERGYPVPFFVAWRDGQPDFRFTDPDKLVACIRGKLCWVCGTQLCRYQTFVIGPMCSVNRVSAEPPSHKECAEYSVRACPFLSKPHMTRREYNMPDDLPLPPGIMIRRNPGVTALWSCREYTPFRDGKGVLFQIGPPETVSWWAEGRLATRTEVLASVESGLPILREMAEKEGPPAVKELEKLYGAALMYFPKE